MQYGFSLFIGVVIDTFVVRTIIAPGYSCTQCTRKAAFAAFQDPDKSDDSYLIILIARNNLHSWRPPSSLKPEVLPPGIHLSLFLNTLPLFPVCFLFHISSTHSPEPRLTCSSWNAQLLSCRSASRAGTGGPLSCHLLLSLQQRKSWLSSLDTGPLLLSLLRQHCQHQTFHEEDQRHSLNLWKILLPLASGRVGPLHC